MDTCLAVFSLPDDSQVTKQSSFIHSLIHSVSQSVSLHGLLTLGFIEIQCTEEKKEETKHCFISVIIMRQSLGIKTKHNKESVSMLF